MSALRTPRMRYLNALRDAKAKECGNGDRLAEARTRCRKLLHDIAHETNREFEPVNRSDV